MLEEESVTRLLTEPDRLPAPACHGTSFRHREGEFPLCPQVLPTFQPCFMYFRG